MKMKVYVDKDTCIGCGLCESICPEVFKMTDDGTAEAIEDELPDFLASAQSAASSCPVSAIKVE